ncbi:MAG TPA: protein kinase, partial [Herpetosiphonaceae bacterium]|nr:protein kinase [Herpetosiphonaceae bacterium]
HLEHPHIVPLYDYWRDPSGAYLVMRYLRSGSLQDRLAQGPLPPEQVLQVLEQVGAGLAVAHRQAVVHRDLKPGNILLDDDGNAYLADFGIAKDVATVNPLLQTTHEGMLGSPAYSAPEQIRDEAVTPRTDIYSLGIVLYEMLAGRHPFTGKTPGEVLVQHLQEPLPRLNGDRPDLPPALDDIIRRATAKQPGERYADVLSLLTDLRYALRAGNGAAPGALLEELLLGDAHAGAVVTQAPLAAVENPYKGLRAFQEADAPDFFGREALVRHLVARLAERSKFQRFLAVVGPSGSGKSSAVRAGLIPALRRSELPGSEQWFVVEMFPGSCPMEELATALTRVAVKPIPDLLGQLRQDERGLAHGIEQVLPEDDRTELVLVIDQFEEAFTLVEDEAERIHFLNSLHVAVREPRSRLRLITTLRADFYDRPLLYQGFGELVRQRTAAVVPLSPAELEEAIVGPARRAGVTVEPELLATLVRDVGEQPGTLPLLQYALTELFEHRKGNTLTLAAYLASGGVLGALSRRADELYAALSIDEQAAARQLFLRLVTLGEGVEDTRRRVLRSELAMLGHDERVLDQVIDSYGRYRLLTFDVEPDTRSPTVEVAHEALIRTWTRLRSWLDASRDELRLQRRLAAAAAEWNNGVRDPSFLATGTRLERFRALAESGRVALNADERAFLEASNAEHGRHIAAEQARRERELAQAKALAEQQRRRAEAEEQRTEEQRRAAAAAQQAATAERSASRRLRYLAAALASFLIVALALSSFAFVQRREAEANLTQAEAQRLAAESQALYQSNGSADLVGLLAVRSLRLQHTPQGDAALETAGTLEYPVQLFAGHTNWVEDAAFSPDGRLVVTASDDRTARLWQAATGQNIVTLEGHTGAVNGVAFSPDGRYVLTGSQDKTAALWDANTGLEVRRFTGHGKAIWDVAFSPDGKYALTGSFDKTAQLWDAQTGQAIRTFEGHTDEVYGVAFSPDGRNVVTSSRDQTTRLWDAETGQTIHVFAGHTEQVRSVAFSPDGLNILTGSHDKTARLWDTQTGQEVRRFT